MSSIYSVKTTNQATTDLDEIHDYIVSSSPQNAKSVTRQLQGAIDSLNVFPHRFPIYESNREVRKQVRSMPVGSFLIYYRILEAEMSVEILHVRHGARNRPPRFFR